MSAEYEAALEIVSKLEDVRQELECVKENAPSQRERIATAALAGLLSDNSDKFESWKEYAKQAVGVADALIAELAKKLTVHGVR